jgi:hypothetical protein
MTRRPRIDAGLGGAGFLAGEAMALWAARAGGGAAPPLEKKTEKKAEEKP